jgi:hypothetical protein
VLLEDREDRHLVEQVTMDERDAVLEVTDPLPVDRAGPPDHAQHLVTLVQQQLGQVGAVLTGDTGDERSLGHDVVS